MKYSLALAFMPVNPEAYLRRGRAYFQLQQWRAAVDDLGLALALHPGNNDYQAWFACGYACGRRDGPGRRSRPTPERWS